MPLTFARLLADVSRHTIGPLVFIAISITAVHCQSCPLGGTPTAVQRVVKRQANQVVNVSGIVEAENIHNVLQAPTREMQAMDQAQQQREIALRNDMASGQVPQEGGFGSGGFSVGVRTGIIPPIEPEFLPVPENIPEGGIGNELPQPTRPTPRQFPLCPMAPGPGNTVPQLTCNPASRYQTLDGACNNLQCPTWGAVGECFRRLLPPQYEDGISQMRLSKNKRQLPNPRDISVKFNSDANFPTNSVSHMHVMFGQFLDHDISLTPFSRTPTGEAIECCPIREDNHPQCAAIAVGRRDPLFLNYNVTCLPLVRSVLCPSIEGPRQQNNQLSAFIDGSQIYGSTEDDLDYLRSRLNGRLAVTENNCSGPLLPRSRDPNNDQCSFPDRNQFCFQAGDQRANQQPPLTSLHTIFVREHNRVASELEKINPQWQDERLFQEARRIVIAQLQMIVYNEFLPPLLGHRNMLKFGLPVKVPGPRCCPPYTRYKPFVNPTLYNEFSTAAFRYGHSMVNSFFPEFPAGNDEGHLLRDIFFKPFELSTGRLENHLAGLANGRAQAFDRHFVKDLTKFLYRTRTNVSGLDLAAINIQRGRDHGLPGYKRYINTFWKRPLNTFRDLDRHGLMSVEYRRILENIYDSVDDIDLYVGGVGEKVKEGITGPLFGYILALQFRNLKFGDRFYFEHENNFTPNQLQELRRTYLARIICDNTKISQLQTRVMELKSYRRNPLKNCQQIPRLRLHQWRE